MNYRQYKKHLPPRMNGNGKAERKDAYAVKCILFLVWITPGYEKIKYPQFVDDFEKFVILTEFQDNPDLYYAKGENKGKLKIPNLNTLRDTWAYRYNYLEDFDEFKKKVAYQVANEVMQNTILSIPEKTAKNRHMDDGLYGLQMDALAHPDLSVKDKAYVSRAIQDSKRNIDESDKSSYELAKDYKQIVDEYNQIIESENENHVLVDFTDSDIHDRNMKSYEEMMKLANQGKL